MDPKIELRNYKKKIDKELQRYLSKKEREYKNISPFSSQLVKHITEFTLRGGKRLRAALFYHTYKMLGGDKEQEITKLSTFIELIHNFLLIHDDIFDHATLRRGKTTFHKMFEKIAMNRKYLESRHFGIVMAILAGDICNQMAYEIIAMSKFDTEKKNKLLKIVAAKTTDVQFGQIYDFLLSCKNNYSEKDTQNINLYKTASYTTEMPILSGAVLANSTEKQLKMLQIYATSVGVAFQIRDDILGLFGKEEKLGKSISSDLEEGKKTLLILKAQNNASRKQNAYIKKYFGKKGLTRKQVNIIQDIVRDTGSLQYSKQKCNDLITKAQKELKKISPANQKSWDFLKNIAEYIVVRDI